VFILPGIEQDNIFSKWQFSGGSGWNNASNSSYIAPAGGLTLKVYRCPAATLPDYSTYQNPGSPGFEMFTTYVGIAGSVTDPTAENGGGGIVSGGGILYPNSAVKMEQIKDGTSNTMLVGEQGVDLLDSNNRAIPGGFGAITSQGPHGWTMGANWSGVPPNYQNGGDNRAFNTTTIRYQLNPIGMSNDCGAGTCDNTGNNIPLSSSHSGGVNILLADGSVRFVGNSIPLTTLQALSTRNGGEIVPSY
jgi:prepilin-type processing-associated H-X9-DG protein